MLPVRAWLSLLLALCLVSSQQGALLHVLSHFAPAAGSLEQGAEGGAHDAGVACDLCLAFDHIAGAVAPTTVAVPLLAPQEHWRLTERFAPRAADVPQARARDPPTAS